MAAEGAGALKRKTKPLYTERDRTFREGEETPNHLPNPHPPKKSRQIPVFQTPTQFRKQKFQRSQDSDYSREISPHFHLKQGLPVQPWLTSCSPSWPLTHGGTPASASLVLRWHACATMPSVTTKRTHPAVQENKADWPRAKLGSPVSTNAGFRSSPFQPAGLARVCFFLKTVVGRRASLSGTFLLLRDCLGTCMTVWNCHAPKGKI